MAKAAVAARSGEFGAIDRLEEKVRLLVGVVDRLRADNAKAADENARLMRDLEAARQQISQSEGAGVELTALREEREQIRDRVDEMLKQIDALNL
jgi:regulator of replication initiation timing